jgi:hypothetical protein
MAPWTFEVKFSYVTHFLFGTLMFSTGEVKTLQLLTRVQRQVITNQSMEKVHIIWQILQHLRHREEPTQV